MTSPHPATVQGGIQNSRFRPAPGLGNPHLQTVWPTLFLRTPPLVPQAEVFPLPDGDFLELMWVARPPAAPPARLLVILHGLEGSWRSPYSRSLLWQAAQTDWTCVVMQFRGCGGRPNRLDRSYHSGDTEDLRAVLASLRNRYPGVPIFAVGYSLGGNVLLKAAGEEGPGSDITAMATVSVPLLLNESAARLEQGWSRFYQWWFLQGLKRKLGQKFAGRTAVPISLDEVMAARTMIAFDDAATAPLHGFDSAQHYYQASSARQYLGRIQIPTLIVQARDDPFMTERLLPQGHELAPHVTLELSAHGGHVGFVAPAAEGGLHWLAGRLLTFLDQNA